MLILKARSAALIDTGTGASYTSSTLIERINKKSITKQYKRIETTTNTEIKSIPVYSVEIPNGENEFIFQTEIS